MESFATLKRRTTDLMQSIPESVPKKLPTVNLPSVPNVNLSSMPKLPQLFGRMMNNNDSNKDDPNTMKGTWERISVRPLPRSSHTVDVVSGTAYIFGGEVRPRQPVDNNMHAVRLPFSGAGADSYAIKAKPAPEPIHHEPQEEGIVRPITVKGGKNKKERELTDIPLGSPPSASAAGIPVIKEPGEDGKNEGVAQEGEAKVDDDEDDESGNGEDTPTTPKPDKGKGLAGPEPLADKVPAPRVGHASAVIGSRVFIFGGRGGADMKTPLDEGGRVWAFDTKTSTWTPLDPVPAVMSPALAPLTLAASVRPSHPSPRSYHCAAATDKPGKPGDDGPSGSGAASAKRRRPSTWREWMEGDVAEVGTPQAPIVGNIAARATDEDAEGYGTFIIHGGCLSDGSRASDVWAFDVRTRVWQQLPDAPGAGRGGAALCISKSRLYRFGGYNGATQEGGRLDYLELGVDSFDDRSSINEVVTVSARGGWLGFAEAPALSVEGNATAPLVEQTPWPAPRSVAGMEVVSTGGGREYVVLLLGEREATGSHEVAGKFLGDVWAFQVPPLGMTPASMTDAIKSVFGRKTGEGRWYRVVTSVFDPDDEEATAEGPGQRGWIATSTMGELEDNAVVVWGGLDSSNKRLGDGWIFRLG